jgi:hypothetical protein
MRHIAHILVAAACLSGLPLAASAQPQPPAPAASASAPAAAAPAAERPRTEPVRGVSCRAISAEMRGSGPYTREAVVRELVRARAEGEMDFHISTTPPALQRPLCPLP